MPGLTASLAVATAAVLTAQPVAAAPPDGSVEPCVIVMPVDPDQSSQLPELIEQLITKLTELVGGNAASDATGSGRSHCPEGTSGTDGGGTSGGSNRTGPGTGDSGTGTGAAEPGQGGAGTGGSTGDSGADVGGSNGTDSGRGDDAGGAGDTGTSPGGGAGAGSAGSGSAGSGTGESGSDDSGSDDSGSGGAGSDGPSSGGSESGSDDSDPGGTESGEADSSGSASASASGDSDSSESASDDSESSGSASSGSGSGESESGSGASESAGSDSGDSDTDESGSSSGSGESESGSGSDEGSESGSDEGSESGSDDSSSESGSESGSDEAASGDTEAGVAEPAAGAGGEQSSGEAATATAGTGGGAGVPGDLLNLKNWYLTLPVGPAGDPESIDQPELLTYSSEHFELTPEGDGVVFRAPAGGVTTENSSYARSELREMAGGDQEAAWSNTSGTHTLETRQAITKTPKVKPEVVSAQIHGGDDDVMQIRLEGETLVAQYADGDEQIVIDPAYKLGTPYDLRIVAANGGITVFYNGERAAEIKASGSTWYWKIGAYTQSNPEKGAAPDAVGEVVVYSLTVEHSGT